MTILVSILLLNACNYERSNKKSSNEDIMSSLKEETSSINSQDENNVLEKETEIHSILSEKEDNFFYFVENYMKPIEKPLKINVVAQVIKTMGGTGVVLNNSQVNELTDKINSLNLQEYNFEKSKIDIPCGGGYLVECYYEDCQITINFISSDIIEKRETGKPIKYYKDNSGNCSEVFDFVVNVLK